MRILIWMKDSLIGHYSSTDFEFYKLCFPSRSGEISMHLLPAAMSCFTKYSLDTFDMLPRLVFVKPKSY